MSKGKSVRDQRRENELEASERVYQKRGLEPVPQEQTPPPVTKRPIRYGRRLLLIVIGSIFVAIAGTLLLVFMLRLALSLGANVELDLQRLIVMLGFIIFYVLSLTHLFKKYMPAGWLAFRKEPLASKNNEYQPPPVKWGGALSSSDLRYAKVFDDSWVTYADPPKSLGNDANEDAPFQSVAVSDPQSEDEGVAEDLHPGVDESFALEYQVQDEGKSATDSTMEDVLAHLSTLIEAITTALQIRGKDLDTSSRFGLNLYFAGACSRLGQLYDLNAKEGLGLLTRLMEVAGSGKQDAVLLTSSINEYGERTQYRKMIDAGSESITRLLSDKKQDDIDNEAEVLDSLLEEWDDPKHHIELPVVLTFMFTDIVGSMDLTERLGDLTMQKIVRTHNRIIRNALKQHNGEEVKHTGDGIMATFVHPQSAVKAAERIQQETNLFGRENPELAFEVRIGLHGGEAVREENDYFGAAVQTAARICATAQGEEIWVSQYVRYAKNDNDNSFLFRGEVALKGVKAPMPLYTVQWERLPDRWAKRQLEYTEIGKAQPV